jgi:hypothetical protein
VIFRRRLGEAATRRTCHPDRGNACQPGNVPPVKIARHFRLGPFAMEQRRTKPDFPPRGSLLFGRAIF